jgi:hypothetical protein
MILDDVTRFYNLFVLYIIPWFVRVVPELLVSALLLKAIL